MVWKDWQSTPPDSELPSLMRFALEMFL